MMANIVLLVILILVLLFSIISDLKEAKIRNVLVLPTVLSGIVINYSAYSLQGLKSSVLGIVLPIILLGIFFYLRLIGAGDIKLFCAIGALLGWNFVVNTMIYSLILAGIFAFINLARAEKLKSTFSDFYQDMKMCFIACDTFYIQNRSSKNIIRLSPAIAIGAILQLLLCSF